MKARFVRLYCDHKDNEKLFWGEEEYQCVCVCVCVCVLKALLLQSNLTVRYCPSCHHLSKNN